MITWLHPNRHGPIGVDLGTRCVKLMQFNADASRLLAAARWDLPMSEELTPRQRDAQLTEGIRRAREMARFRGRDAVLCASAPELFAQNLRVPPAAGEALEQIVRQEAAGRLPFDAAETEIRFLQADDVRMGESLRREVVLLATHKPALDRNLAVIQNAGLRPRAVDAEPLAVVRCYAQQYRRDEDRRVGAMYVHVGASNTSVVIARGSDVLFVKYLQLGGCQLDEAVARQLNMKVPEAASLRRHHGERRSDRHDPELGRTLSDAVRPVIQQLAEEVAKCLRYHSVTFHGQSLERFVLSGGEASSSMLEPLQQRVNLAGELGNPLRGYERTALSGRNSQWDVAAGLALRETA